MAKGNKNKNMNQELRNSEFADEIVAKNTKQPAQNNPSEGASKNA